MATLNNIKAANYEISYYRNDEFDLSIAVTDSDGDPVDLSVKTIKLTLKSSTRATSNVLQLTTASEITISGVNNNIITFSGTYDLDRTSYAYDLENTTDAETIMYGLFLVTQDITRV